MAADLLAPVRARDSPAPMTAARAPTRRLWCRPGGVLALFWRSFGALLAAVGCRRSPGSFGGGARPEDGVARGAVLVLCEFVFEVFWWSFRVIFGGYVCFFFLD